MDVHAIEQAKAQLEHAVIELESALTATTDDAAQAGVKAAINRSTHAAIVLGQVLGDSERSR